MFTRSLEAELNGKSDTTWVENSSHRDQEKLHVASKGALCSPERSRACCRCSTQVCLLPIMPLSFGWRRRRLCLGVAASLFRLSVVGLGLGT
jgi:hypothetical protein